MDAQPDGERDVTQAREVAEDVPELQTVVARVALSELREAAVAPVEVAAVDDCAAKRGAVAADPLRERLDDDCCTVLDGTREIRRRERVVDNERHPQLATCVG